MIKDAFYAPKLVVIGGVFPSPESRTRYRDALVVAREVIKLARRGVGYKNNRA